MCGVLLLITFVPSVSPKSDALPSTVPICGILQQPQIVTPFVSMTHSEAPDAFNAQARCWPFVAMSDPGDQTIGSANTLLSASASSDFSIRPDAAASASSSSASYGSASRTSTLASATRLQSGS